MNDQVLCLLVTLVLVLFGVWIVLRVDSRRNDQLISAFIRIKALEDSLVTFYEDMGFRWDGRHWYRVEESDDQEEDR